MMSALHSLIVVLFLLVVGGTAGFLWMSSTELEARYVEPPKPVLLPSQIEKLSRRIKAPDTAEPVSLTNKSGKTISAYLTSKNNNTVTFISGGKQFTLELSKLNDASRAKVDAWQPR